MNGGHPLDDAIGALERVRRHRIAADLATARALQIQMRIAERTEEIIGRFPPNERALIVHDWPIARMAAMACVPEVIECVLDALADGFSPWLLEKVAERCLNSPPPTSSSPPSADG